LVGNRDFGMEFFWGRGLSKNMAFPVTSVIYEFHD
jgi:hypothetical protein